MKPRVSLRTYAFLLFLVFLAGLYPIFLAVEKNYDKRITFINAERATLINRHLSIARAYVHALSQQLHLNITLSDKGQLSHPLSQKLQNFPGKNAFGLTDETVQLEHLDCSLSGIGPLANLSNTTRKEIDAALALDIASPIQDEVKDFIWSYYTSKNQFIYLCPAVSVDSYYLQPQNYQKPFWWVATPQNNPGRNTVLTTIYDDAGGQGLMITLSKPVYVKDDFRGVVSVDLGIKSLRKSLSIGQDKIYGESILFADSGLVVAKPSNFSVGEKIPYFNDLTDRTLQSNLVGGNSYHTHTIKDFGLFVTHVESQTNRYFHIGIRMLLPGMLYGFFLIIVFLLVKLSRTLNKVKQLARIDELTGLLNRREIEKLTLSQVEQAQRNNQPISFMMLDVDFFKKVNDTYGHPVGDKVLIKLAETFKNRLRKTDIIGRYGGEEFFIILPNTDLTNASHLSETIRKTVEGTAFNIDHFSMSVTISIGCTEHEENENIESTMKRVDDALYTAKRNGRNRAEIL